MVYSVSTANGKSQIDFSGKKKEGDIGLERELTQFKHIRIDTTL